MMARRLVFLMLAASSLAACGLTTAQAGDTHVGAASASSPALDVARLLAEGDRLARQGRPSARQLGRIVTALDGLGAHPASADGADELAHWRAALPADTPPMRGRILGPAFRKGQLSPGAAVDTEQLFLAGQRANVALTSPDHGNLRITVVDAKDQPVCEEDAEAAELTCSWLPMFSGRHRIRVANVGSQSTRYYLVTN